MWRGFAGAFLTPVGGLLLALGFNGPLNSQSWIALSLIVIGVLLLFISLIIWLPWETISRRLSRATSLSLPDQSHGSSPWLNRPPIDEARFFGREPDLEAIDSAFQNNQVVVVYGGVGYGKTRLAAEYTQYSGSSGFWTKAGDNVTQTLAELAPHLGIETANSSREDIARAVRVGIHSVLPGTLWVLDNLGNLDQVNALRGDLASIQLLVTSRDSRHWILPHSVKTLELEVLSPPAAVALLAPRRPIDPKDRETLEAIAEMVGYLPLALEMLAVQLIAPGQNPGTVLAALHREPNRLQLDRFRETEGFTIPRPAGDLVAIRGTLALLSDDSRERLSPLGYVADGPIPVALFEALTGVEETAAEKLYEECGRQSILNRTENQIRIHSLTIAAIAATNTEGGLEAAIRRGGQRLTSINTNDPVGLRTEIMHHERIRAHARRFIGVEDLDVLEYANNLAIGYMALGRTTEAVKLFEETLAVRERLLGQEHGDTLQSRNNLAVGYVALSRTAEAVRLYEETLTIKERVLGREHADTLRTVNNLAIGYSTVGRTAEAIKLFEETLAIMERVLGPKHSDTLKSRHNLAAGYGVLGQSAEVVKVFEETLVIMERVLGLDHPYTLKSRHNLAAGYRALGRSSEAANLDEETLSFRERVLGPEHSDTLQSRYNLARAYRSMGRDADADRLELRG